jgi:hypothetical protein
MRVLIMAKEDNQSEAATPPTPEAMAEYQKFNEELVKAGVVLEAGRLHPSSQSKRVRFDGKKRTVIDGPFAESKELVAGYWLWQVRSIDEALEWLRSSHRTPWSPRSSSGLRKACRSGRAPGSWGPRSTVRST